MLVSQQLNGLYFASLYRNRIQFLPAETLAPQLEYRSFIKDFMYTIGQVAEMFEAQRVHMEAELEQMNRTLDMLKFKCWYYEQAIKDGSEDRLKALIPDHLPDGIRKAYENAHR